MPQSSNVLSFVPVPNTEHGQRRNVASPPRPGVEDEVVLRKIAEAALSATGADGAALALRRDGEVVCVARAGEMAPPLEARLDDTSGISGECLREGQPVRVDDTESDQRVDAEACRSLGLRSLAVAAVQQDGEVVGILEVFSQNPSTFTDRHLEVLRQLAELVIAESEGTAAEVESPPVTKSPPEASSVASAPQPRLLPAKSPDGLSNGTTATAGTTAAGAPVAVAYSDTTGRTSAVTPLPSDVNISAYMAAHEKAQSQAPPRIPKVVLVGLATILVASFVGWYLGHRKPDETVPTAAVQFAPLLPATNAQFPAASTPAANTGTQPSPDASSATSSDSQRQAKSASGSLTNAAAKNRITSNSLGVAKDVIKPVTAVPPAASTNLEAEVAPPLPVANGAANSGEAFSALLNTPAAMPSRAPPISQGVEGGDLETQVGAIYPAQARAAGQHGVVVLELLVAPNGSVKDVKVVSGAPMLRQAAVDAVRRWKYHPFRLNGKPISGQTQVEIDFKLQ